MSALAVADSAPISFTDQELIAEYTKLIQLRDNVFANKPSQQGMRVGSALSSYGPQSSPAPPSTKVSNGVSKPPEIGEANAHLQAPPSQPFQHKPPNFQKIPNATSGALGIDPIFLTKSDVLVRAEIQQKRQRIERLLEEVLQQKKRQKAFDQDALPDIDTTQVLRKAQELVKPFQLPNKNAANRNASSSDSFDERTFYSSQMNESTSTEELDDSHKWRPRRICNFFLRGERCRYGDACTFSHDPALKQRIEGNGSRDMDFDSSKADKQKSSRQDHPPNREAAVNGAIKDVPAKGTSPTLPSAQSQTERSLQERVAQLEAELRNSRREAQRPAAVGMGQLAKATQEHKEDSGYSPPGPDEFGRNIDLREPEARQPIAQQAPSNYQSLPTRGNGKRDANPLSPLADNLHIRRNHITSPIAPQPTRVSPLAVAKVPQVSQIQRSHSEIRRTSRGSNAGNLSVGQSPNVIQQPQSSRKRRREVDSGEQIRNVIPRRDPASPEVRIKAEPVSPPPFASVALERRRISERQEPQRQLYVDTVAPPQRNQEPIYIQPRVAERLVYGQVGEDRRPITPLARRVISRNDNTYIAQDEQDLRRVVSARHVRAPMSPAPYPMQHAATQPRATRAASQIYGSPSGPVITQQYRASVQPQPAVPASYGRSPSPRFREIPQSPGERQPVAMAPPPRRIVVDQWGNRFMETPVATDRHVSLAPAVRQIDFGPRYEQVVPRDASARQSQYVRVDDDHEYIQSVRSPAPNGFVEIPRGQVPDSRSGIYDGAHLTLNNGFRATEHTNLRPVQQYEDLAAPQEGITRMQSVRPVQRQYELQREQVPRLQSVRPQQPRIVNLGEKLEARAASRPISVRPEPMAYAVEERPRYQYVAQAQDRSHVEEIPDEVGLYEAPSSGARRMVQRA